MASFYFSEGVYTRSEIIENDEMGFSKPQIFKKPNGFFKTKDLVPLRLGEDKVIVPKRGFFKTR